MKKGFKSLLIALVFVGFFLTQIEFLGNAISGNSSTIIESSYQEERELVEVKLDRVVDGDTIRIKNDSNESIKVRLIGINTPESVHSDETKNCEEGKIASDFLVSYLEENCTDNILYLEYDVEQFDKYDRTLAYVYLNESIMLQEVLLSNGMAECMFVGENLKYKAQFEKLENKAKQESVGFWE